jgi:hypothetical protein
VKGLKMMMVSDSMRCCMGTIVVIQGDCLMMCRLDCAYMAYHPDLNRYLPKMEVSIALKACLLTAVASNRTESWQHRGVAQDILRERSSINTIRPQRPLPGKHMSVGQSLLSRCFWLCLPLYYFVDSNRINLVKV